MPAKPKGAIYLQRDKFQIYVPGLPQILEVRFPIEVVREMDIVNQEMFANIIKTFVTTTKMQPSKLIIALSDNVSFLKDITQPTPVQQPPQPGQPPKPPTQPELLSKEELERKAKDFFSFVPFEEVSTKIIPLKNGIRAYATNKDLYEAIKRSFEALYFEVPAVIPAIAFGPEVSSKPAMDAAVAGIIMTKADALMKEYNLLTQPILTLESEKEESETTEGVGENEKPKSQLPLLLGVFGFLLVVLAIVAYIQFKPTPPKPTTPAPLPPAAAPTTAVTPSTPSSVSPAAATTLNTKTLTVSIINTSTVNTQALALHDALTKLDFKSVNVQTQQNIAATKTTVTFSTNVNETVKAAVLEQIQKISQVSNVYTKSDTTTDITILLGK